MIRSYTEILLAMCDALDSYIAPKKIKRSDDNFVYLVLKAIAKGYEIINNSINLLRNKFDPETCADADLYSIARIAGTSPKSGTGSGLSITCTNEHAEDSIVLLAGVYRFKLNDDIHFDFPVDVSLTIEPLESKTFLAFSNEQGSYHVDDVADLDVFEVSDLEIDSSLHFSCIDNSGLLGYEDESSLDFRKRVLSDPTRQDIIKELEMDIRNLPFIFDCNLFFNQTLSAVDVDGISVDPFHLLIVIHGDARPELAEVVARKTIYPTTLVEAEDFVPYYSTLFAEGEYKVYYTEMGYEEYDVEISYAYSEVYNTEEDIEREIRKVLKKFENPSQYKRFVTEADMYSAINELNINSFSLLGVDLEHGGEVKNHINIPVTKLPKLVNITFDARNKL